MSIREKYSNRDGPGPGGGQTMNQKTRTEIGFESKNGRTFVRRKVFNDKGNLILEGLFGQRGSHWEWNLPAGTVRRFYDNGQLESEEIHNEHGDKDGECRYFTRDGKLLVTKVFSKNKLVSESEG